MRYYSILPNYHLAVQLALKHLRINGHQLIAYLGGVNTFGDHKELTMDPVFTITGPVRLTGTVMTHRWCWTVK